MLWRVVACLLVCACTLDSAHAQQIPRTAAPQQQDQEETGAAPSERGQSHLDETDPFLKYAENVQLRISQLDLRDFPTVRAFTSVKDQQGMLIKTLRPEHFTLEENQAGVDGLRFAERDELNMPLAIMFVVDISGSMEGQALELEKQAIREFVAKLGADDRVGLITFSDAAIPEVPLTSDKQQLLRALETMTAWGQTALWDGIFRGLEELLLDPVPARKAMLVLSDGADNRSVETPQTISQLYTSKGTEENKGFAVYCMGLGSQIEREALRSIATVTSGMYMDSPTPADLARVYQDILSQIQSEYVIEYDSPTTAQPGQIIDIKLGLNNVRSFTPATYTYRSPGLAAALGRVLWPGLVTICVLLAILIAATIFRISRRSWLTVMITPLEGRDYNLAGETLDIGSSEVCAIRVGRDNLLQPVHASLREMHDGWLLEAYDPQSPIVYGKQILSKRLLRHGDAFILGATTFVFNERIDRPGSGSSEPAGALLSQSGTSSTLPPLSPDVPAEARQGPPSLLKGISGPYSGQHFSLNTGETIIGRTEGQVVLGNDNQVSRRHCQIILSADTATVCDLGSTNGTRLNGQPLQPGLAVPLRRGDRLGVGNSEFQAD